MGRATKAPRLVIWLMACIALAALNFGVMRRELDLEVQLIYANKRRLAEMIWLLVMGALPMLNALGIVLVIGLRRRGSHRFVWGFVLFGAIALALYVAAVNLYFDWMTRVASDLLWPIVVALRNWQGDQVTRKQALIIESFVAVILLLPQLALALVGGFLFRMVGPPTWRETIRRLNRPRFTMFQGMVVMGAISIWLWLGRMRMVWIFCGSLVVLLALLAGSRRSHLTQEIRATGAPVTVWMRLGIAGYWVALILALCWIVCILVAETLAPSKSLLR